MQNNDGLPHLPVMCISPDLRLCLGALQVEKKLATRLQAGLQAWTAALLGQRQKDEDIDIPMDTDTPDKPTHKPGGDPKVRFCVCWDGQEKVAWKNSLREAMFQVTVIRKGK